MADKYVEIDATTGYLQEVEGTVESTGETEAGKIVALDATGKLDDSVMPTGIGAEIKIMTTSEDLAAGNFVNVYDDGGTITARKADATTSGKEASGFVLASSTSGNNATVYVNGINNQLTGLSGGPVMFLDTTAVASSATPPSSTGNVIQRVGTRLSATEIAFEPGDPVILA